MEIILKILVLPDNSTVYNLQFMHDFLYMKNFFMQRKK